MSTACPVVAVTDADRLVIRREAFLQALLPAFAGIAVGVVWNYAMS